MAWRTLVSSRCWGSGSSTRMPCTLGSAMRALICCSSRSSVTLLEKRMSCTRMEQRSAISAFRLA